MICLRCNCDIRFGFVDYYRSFDEDRLRKIVKEKDFSNEMTNGDLYLKMYCFCNEGKSVISPDDRNLLDEFEEKCIVEIENYPEIGNKIGNLIKEIKGDI